MQGSRSVLAFDYGTKSIGVAIGQEITASASPLTALKAKDGIPNWDDIGKILNEWKPDLVVVGLPLDLDGNELESIAPRCRKFANRLNGRFGCTVVLHDERLSTVAAKAELFEHGGYKALSKGNIDSQSAVIILESWFERQV
ncbi:MAG: Holliday junction resolvase RuvX [Pseudomonadales bacterium]|nr:Holliday junction resolvase RuvX [Pseudomonadales bacterium]